jgi:chaperonin cofactor prefoldin
LQAQLAAQQARIAQLQRENEAADNVRSFAAETEREIAQLQRELREARSKLTQMTLERDRLESELRDVREDSDTMNRRVPPERPTVERLPAERDVRDYDPENTAQLDLSRYESTLAKTAELELQVETLRREEQQLRARLADTEERLREAIEGSDDDGVEHTHTGSQLPIDVAEHVNILDESIDSLRAEMRAASDETAVMEQTESVVVVANAVSSAAEHIERARAAVRTLKAAIGMN